MFLDPLSVQGLQFLHDEADFSLPSHLKIQLLLPDLSFHGQYALANWTKLAVLALGELKGRADGW